MLQEFKLYALHLWATERVCLKHVIVPEEFTTTIAIDYVGRVREIVEATDKKEENNIKQPDSFSGKTNEWPAFYKLFVNYVKSRKNCNRISLGYVLHTADKPADEDQVFKTQHEKVIMTTPHEGVDYVDDNGFVWDTIQALTLKGSAYAYIGGFDKDRDGRGAIKTLIGHYKGTASMSRAKQAAYNEIDNTMYTGERSNFIFENYINRHVKAHQILSELGVVLDGENKVSDFL